MNVQFILEELKNTDPGNTSSVNLEQQKLAERIADRINDYTDWKETILLKMLRGESLQSILDTVSEKVVNSFSVLDSNGFIMGRTRGYDKIPAGTIWDNLKGNYLNLYDFYDPKEWKQLSELIAKAGRGHILFQSRRDNQHLYYTINLFDGDTVIGSIGAMDNVAPFTEDQLELLRMVRDLLEIYFHTRYDAVRSEKVTTASFNHMINGKYDSDAMRKSLNKRHWNEQDRYLMLSFDFAYIIGSEMELASALRLIRLQYPKTMLGVRNKQMVLIVRAQDLDLSCEKNVKELEAFLKQYDLYCGISYDFCGFTNCMTYVEQSSYAASKGIKRNIRLVRYKDVHLDHIFDSLPEKEESRKLCHPVIAELSCSEKTSDQVLVPCLKAYLLNGQNIAHAAEALHIHRNTLIYRIERLEKLLGISFEQLSQEETMSLLFSCWLVEKEKGHDIAELK